MSKSIDWNKMASFEHELNNVVNLKLTHLLPSDEYYKLQNAKEYLESRIKEINGKEE